MSAEARAAPAAFESDPGAYLDVLVAAFAKQYGEGSDEWTRDAELRAFPSIVQGVVKLPATAQVLDIGCGAGADVAYYASIYRLAVGVDLYRHGGWDALAGRLGNARFVAGDFVGTGVDGQFDLAADNGCLHHQHPDRYGAYLAAVAAALLPGGWYALSTFKNPERDYHVDGNGRLHRYFADGELRRMLDAAGFEVVTEFDMYRRAKADYYRLTFCRR